MRLDIGCGANKREGFTGIDAFVIGEDIVNAPMWELPFADNSIESIYSSHALEHIPKRAVIPTLREWLRVLRPEGYAEIHVPDLEWCMRDWLQRKTNDWWLDIIFGNQEHPGEFHMTGYTKEIMFGYLIEAGFVNVQSSYVWSHRQNTLVFHAEKI